MKKILLVEDDHTLGSILKDQLEVNGYEVSHLVIPSKTIEYLNEDEFDLVILDKLLSGIDGTHICSKIRKTDNISNIPILMMSGFDGAGEICLSAGANSFIAKPFEVNSFLKSIEETLGKEKNSKVN